MNFQSGPTSFLHMLAALVSFALFSPLQHIEVNVDGTVREALVAYGRSTGGKSPLVFAFHGHGGNMNYSANKYGIDKLWPEATVVYMQGVPTYSPRVDLQGKYNGWQLKVGDLGDRDIKFFDKALQLMRSKGNVDESRIYTMGHSNGALFSYVLWMAHPGLFAGLGIVAGGFGAAGDVKPVPVIQIAGEKDPLVPYRYQVFTISRMRKINQCSPNGQVWEDAGSTLWKSSIGDPVVLCTHPGGHNYPTDASEKIVRFFKQNVKH